MKTTGILILLMALTGCALGTGTGNPFNPSSAMNPGSGNGDPQSGASTITSNIFVNVCKMIEKCNPGMTDQICGEGIHNLTSFGPKLGMLMNPWPTVEQIVYLDFTHQIFPDAVAGDKCVAQMLKLQCTDPVLQNAYVASAPVPFAGASEILDPVCAGVFAQ
jgi:hypothetical protein